MDVFATPSGSRPLLSSRWKRARTDDDAASSSWQDIYGEASSSSSAALHSSAPTRQAPLQAQKTVEESDEQQRKEQARRCDGLAKALQQVHELLDGPTDRAQAASIHLSRDDWLDFFAHRGPPITRMEQLLAKSQDGPSTIPFKTDTVAKLPLRQLRGRCLADFHGFEGRLSAIVDGLHALANEQAAAEEEAREHERERELERAAESEQGAAHQRYSYGTMPYGAHRAYDHDHGAPRDVPRDDYGHRWHPAQSSR